MILYLNLLTSLIMATTDTASSPRFTPQDLPYAYDALAPAISEETMHYHHDKHYAGYVDKLNELIVETPFAGQPLEDIILSADGPVYNNAAQAWNHAFFFGQLSPKPQKEPSGELLEAINAGKTALHTVNEVLETLDNAEGWSTWDVMGGGLGVDLAKYAELDDAQEQIEQLQVELRRFKTELSDVEITADLQVTVDSFLKFADFFFDGLFADWAVLDHINQAQSRVENTKGQIKRVLALLKKMREDIDVQIADEKEKQEQLAVETEL